MTTLSIRWWGQACFTISDGTTTVLTDPFPADFGYRVPDVEPQVVLVSHEHRDHNSVEVVRGKPAVVRGAGRHEAAGLRFTGLASCHDDKGGAQRGQNTLFVWELGGWRLAHLGDLGAPLNDEQLAGLAAVDILMIPVGGYYTIEPAQAAAEIARVKPAFVLPMHYRTAAVPRLPIAPVDEFLKVVAGKGWEVQRPAETTLSLTAQQRPAAPVVIVLPPA